MLMTTTEQVPPRPVENERAPVVSARGKLAYGLMLAGGTALAATGIGTFALGKPPMSHWMLMAHVSAAPLFAIGLALVSLTWADRCRFGDAASRQSGLAKALFWLILLCGVVVILSGVVPMTPVFGTGGQHALYLIHRYTAIVLTGTVGLHLLSLRRGG
jgi:cytochrome b subunit of formate dehydrogenase